MATLSEIEEKATEMAGRPVGISIAILNGTFGLTDGQNTVVMETMSDAAWDEPIETFGPRYIEPMVASLRGMGA